MLSDARLHRRCRPCDVIKPQALSHQRLHAPTVISASALLRIGTVLARAATPGPPAVGLRPTVAWLLPYATSVFTAAVISASAFFASAKYMLVLELAYSSLSMPA